MSDDLGTLRRELVARFEAHPVRTWSAALLAAMIATIDLAFDGGQPAVAPGRYPRLRLVTDEVAR